MDPHHPMGRRGDNLFHFFYVDRMCHLKIHNNPKWAREKGFLYREIPK
jgi:hypothetical protein